MKEDIHSELDNAAENGYNFEGWTVEEIALDMIDKSAFCENESVRSLAPYIMSWLVKRNTVC